MKDLLELLKNINKRIYLLSLVFVVIINLGLLKGFSNQKERLLTSGMKVLYSSWSLILIIIVLVSILKLLQVSDRKSRDRIKEHLYSPFNYETEGDFVNLSVHRYYQDEIKNGILEIIEVKLNNTSKEDIELIRGFVYFYKDKTRIKTLNVELYNLRGGFSERIFLSDNNDTNHLLDWDSFELFVSELTTKQSRIQNSYFRSKLYIKTHYFILNYEKFVDHKFLGIRLNYNLAWIKRVLNTEVVPRITFFYKRKKYYIGESPSLIKELVSLLQRFIAFTIIYFLLFLVSILVLYAVIDVIRLLMELARLWFPLISRVVQGA
ncbi:hypothetical protein EJP77_18715 [Paenibacillus zeisoli]|uniref:Uncharacterized protein n=1 Tax=Paenibacillus zeisoli TaxID=2496267 RepID=A0A3S1D6Z6_9BACL|nr:hypothetical protein [Paenibacillus zeisoli]RUT28049.1 hypothetical protein EJP77_18715 [Paenibacillus zeisoli]